MTRCGRADGRGRAWPMAQCGCTAHAMRYFTEKKAERGWVLGRSWVLGRGTTGRRALGPARTCSDLGHCDSDPLAPACRLALARQAIVNASLGDLPAPTIGAVRKGRDQDGRGGDPEVVSCVVAGQGRAGQDRTAGLALGSRSAHQTSYYSQNKRAPIRRATRCEGRRLLARGVATRGGRRASVVSSLRR